MTALLRAKLSWRLDGAASHAPHGTPFHARARGDTCENARPRVGRALATRCASEMRAPGAGIATPSVLGRLTSYNRAASWIDNGRLRNLFSALWRLLPATTIGF